MANIFLVFVVLAAGAQVSVATQSETLDAWKHAAEVVYAAITNSSLNLTCAKDQYLAYGRAGGLAFVKAASVKVKNQQTLSAAAEARYKQIAGLVFDAIGSARKANRATFNSINAGLVVSLGKIPVREGVEYYFRLAGSKAPTQQAISDLDTVYALYFASIKSLAEAKAGKEKSTDPFLSKSSALSAITAFTADIWRTLSTQG